MTPKQERFVREYLIDLNATQAAIRAGYSAKTAEQIGHQLLKKTSVAEAISDGQKKLAAKQGVTVEKIVSELAKLGFANMADYMEVGPDGLPRLNWSSLTREQAAALTEVTVEQVGDTPQRQKRNEELDDDIPVPVHKVKFKLADKKGALVDLGRHLGMFIDKIEHSGSADFAARLVKARERQGKG